MCVCVKKNENGRLIHKLLPSLVRDRIIGEKGKELSVFFVPEPQCLICLKPGKICRCFLKHNTSKHSKNVCVLKNK